MAVFPLQQHIYFFPSSFFLQHLKIVVSAFCGLGVLKILVYWGYSILHFISSKVLIEEFYGSYIALGTANLKLQIHFHILMAKVFGSSRKS